MRSVCWARILAFFYGENVGRGRRGPGRVEGGPRKGRSARDAAARERRASPVGAEPGGADETATGEAPWVEAERRGVKRPRVGEAEARRAQDGASSRGRLNRTLAPSDAIRARMAQRLSRHEFRLQSRVGDAIRVYGRHDHGAGLLERIVSGDRRRVWRAIASKDGDGVVQGGEKAVVIVLVHALHRPPAEGRDATFHTYFRGGGTPRRGSGKVGGGKRESGEVSGGEAGR